MVVRLASYLFIGLTLRPYMLPIGVLLCFMTMAKHNEPLRKPRPEINKSMDSNGLESAVENHCLFVAEEAVSAN